MFGDLCRSFSSAVSCSCGGAVEESTTRNRQVRDCCCMSVDCIESCFGGIGELANPLQWPQLRKKRRFFLLRRRVASLPIPLAAPPSPPHRPTASFRPMPYRTGASPPPTSAMISAPRRSPWPRR